MNKAKRTFRESRPLLAVSTIALCIPVSMVQAQDAPPPPQQDTTSGTGVSLVSGGYSTSSTDLQIGQGEFPQALVLSREYSSSLQKHHATLDGLIGWGWSTNVTMYMTIGKLGGNDYPVDEPLHPTENRFPWRYGVSVGTGSIASFVEPNPPSHPNPGPKYTGPFNDWGSGSTPGRLDRVGDDMVYTALDGTRHIFEGGSRQTFPSPTNTPPFRTRLEAKDGTILQFNGIRAASSVFSNRGIAILFEFEGPDERVWTKACAVNLTEHYVTADSDCPSGVPFVSYQHGPVIQQPFNSYTIDVRDFTRATDQLGRHTTYEYTSDRQLDCIKLSGQTGCQVQNYYTNCVPIPNEPEVWSMNADQQVYRQDFITGESIQYDFDLSRQCPAGPPSGTSPDFAKDVVMTASNGTTRTVRATYEGLPESITDELGRETRMVHGKPNVAGRATTLLSVTAEEGNSWHYEYDDTQISKTTIKPKTGPGEQVWETIYGGENVCNQPVAVIDANGNQTDIEYSTVHCGVLKRTGPADNNGIRPQTRYSYTQKYAWIKNSSGGFTQESSPVWVMATEEYCRTTAASGNGCAGGSSDEVVTTYEYQSGNASKGSNVFQIGVAVTADNTTLRTCYGLDEFGRQISETQPKANLASCAS